MSAYVVSDKTISVIAKGLIDYGIDCSWIKWDPMQTILINKRYTPLGQSLLEQNVRSVAFRYSHNDLDTYQKEFKDHIREFEFDEEVECDEGTLLGCIDCYVYQSCETPDFERSGIGMALKMLERKMLERFIKRNFMEIPWGVD